MRFFPQLASGAAGQYPLRARRSRRAVVNEMEDGRAVKLADDGAGLIEWRLAFDGLSDADAAALEQFFTDSEGRLAGFTYLDPGSNLLAWSEKLDHPAWQPPPLLQITAGISDPLGTARASRLANPAGAPLRISQPVNGPEWFVYAFSVYARSGSGGRLRLVRTGSASESSQWTLTPQWRRYLLAGKFDGPQESVAFSLEVDAGAAVDVFGAQVEAQPGASGYKKTGSRGGVYPDARFQDDEIEIVAEGVNWNSCSIRIGAAA
jgi:hypothetical protein